MKTKKLINIIMLILLVGNGLAYEMKDFTNRINITQTQEYINQTYNMAGIKIINIYPCSLNKKYGGYWHPLTTKTSKISLYICDEFDYDVWRHEWCHNFLHLKCGSKCLYDNKKHGELFKRCFYGY